jgi:uncharacterized protein
LLEPVLEELVVDAPAVLLVGPRASGKTTTAARRADSVVRLDQASERLAVIENPDAVLNALDGTILIDEWQLAPGVLGAVKRAVDNGAPPGRFLLTGSTRADLSVDGWPATGRILRLPMWNLSRREITGNPTDPSLIDLLFDERLDELVGPSDPPDIGGYIDMAIEGGFPALHGRGSQRYRNEWLSGYVDQSVRRDTQLVGSIRDPQRLHRYLEALAANSAGVVSHKTLYDAAGIDRATANSYDSLLEQLYLTEQVPPWSTNYLSRLSRTSKRYLIEPALTAALLRLDRRGIVRNADLTGRFVDSFVLAQLRPELTACESRPSPFHLRNTDGDREVDLLLEGPGGRVVAIEIKSASAPGGDAWRHLVWLRDKLGDRFACGVFFHTGPRVLRPAPKVVGLPICTIWSRSP